MIDGLMNREGKLHALLATSRMANVPSVAVNVWTGVVLGWLHTGMMERIWLTAALLATAGVALYIGGNFLNDWMDRKWDAQHRPERALPRGLFPPGFYLRLAGGLMAGGVWLAALVNFRCALVAAAIVLCIIIYTVWHKRAAWTVIPMGMCRGLLPVMGFMACHRYIDGIWPVALGLLFYIAGLSLTARQESKPDPAKTGLLIARALLLGTALLVAWGNKGIHLERLPSVAGALPYLGWTGFCLRFRRRPVPRLVSGLLAGIPWVDAMVLLPVGWLLVRSATGDGAVVGISCLVAAPLAFASSLLLQRVAPAT
jgi:4-hydroxybenzoate polyprenyltransferase